MGPFEVRLYEARIVSCPPGDGLDDCPPGVVVLKVKP